MTSFWQSIKESFLKYVEEDDYVPPEKRGRSRSEEKEMASMEAMRIPPHEKPSQIAVCIPESPDEEWRPAEYIKSDRPVVVKFLKLHGDDRDQVRNFMLGVIWALDGTYTKLNEDIFLFAPKDVGIITKHNGTMPMMEREFFTGDLNPEDLL